jgi:hypothetical protein
VFIEQFAKTECGVTIDITVLAELFELTRSRMRAGRAKALSRQESPSRLPALSDEQELELCQIMPGKAVTDNYVAQRELINYIEANHRVSLAHGESVVFSVPHR